MHDHTDTWGIPSQTFLQWYLVAAAVAIGLSLYSRMTARRSPVVVDAVRRPLTPPEIGALTSDYQAVLASMAILRSAELISTEGKDQAGTHCGGQESSRLVHPYGAQAARATERSRCGRCV